MCTLKEETVDGYENFQIRIQELDNTSSNEKRIILLFRGNDKEDGTNWCPDCRDLDNLLETLKPELEKSTAHFIRVNVGHREEWKSPNCTFRTDPELKLTSIPTVMIWKTKEKESDLKTLLTKHLLLGKFGI